MLRHNVYITNLMSNGDPATFTTTLFCPFVPDEVKVRQLGYATDGTNTDGIFAVLCDTLTGSPAAILGSVVDPSVTFAGAIFPLNGSVNGTHLFYMTQSGAVSTDLDGNLNIMLEFRKWV